MKTCPTCGKEFEDSMKFCQVDGSALVDAEPAFDPYATMIGQKLDLTKEETSGQAEAVGEVSGPQPPTEEPMIHETSGSIPIGQPDEVLELPGADPLKTMYVSPTELEEALGTSESAPQPPADESLPESNSESEPTIVAEPPAFGGPPPSPFSVSDASRPFAEHDPSMPSSSSQFGDSFASSSAEWSPPPAPVAAWQDQPIGANTPFQPPPAGGAGPSSGLATGSLICGVLSCVCCFSVITGPAAVIMGFIAKKKADENPAEFAGRGLAMGGIITGAIGFVLGVVLVILQIFFGALGSLMGNMPN